MIYDERVSALPAAQLALIVFRRNLELATASVIAAGIAMAIGLPLRLRHPPIGVRIFPLVLAGAIALVFVRLMRSPPAPTLERFAKVIDERRKAGVKVGAVSRRFIALATLLSFAVSLSVSALVPL